MAYEKDPKEGGVFWKKVSKKGLTFMSGKITQTIKEGTFVAIFKQEGKRSEKAPDYRMVISDEKPKPATAVDKEIKAEDLPF